MSRDPLRDGHRRRVLGSIAVSLALAALLVLASASISPATAGDPQWTESLFARPGVDALAGVFGMTAGVVFDDGDGPLLHVARGAHVHQWDGDKWSLLGEIPIGNIGALERVDTAAGSELWAAAGEVYRWDGTEWLPAGTIVATVGGGVRALKTIHDVSGTALYLVGGFTSIDGVPANGVARWDGTTWSAFGSGVDEVVRDLEIFDDGQGSALYVAHSSGVSRWSGSSWETLPAAAAGLMYSPRQLATFDDGTGPALYVGGAGVFGERLARWDGTAWSSVGGGLNNPVDQLHVHDDGTGAKLYATGGSITEAGGTPAAGIASWDGTAWAALGAGTPGGGGADLVSYVDGRGPALYVVGSPAVVGGDYVNGIARWQNGSWSGLTHGIKENPVSGFAGPYVTTVLDLGDGPHLYVGGSFDGPGPSPYYFGGIARWNGSRWEPLGTGFDIVGGGWTWAEVHDLVAFDDGSGLALIAAGRISTSDGAPTRGVSRWTGTVWEQFGPEDLNGWPYAMTVFEGELYIAGNFTEVDGTPLSYIGKWNGTTWVDVGGGVNDWVYDLAVYDVDGTGPADPALIAGGNFTLAGGGPANYVAAWNGSSWSPLGLGVTGLGSEVRTLMETSLFGDPLLVIGGRFTTAGGLPAANLASWDGANLEPLGAISSYVLSLAEHDDGSGPALYVGGNFFWVSDCVGCPTVPAPSIARFDGTSFSTLDTGVVHSHGGGSVNAMASFADDPLGPAAIYAGGYFTSAGGFESRYMARWGEPRVRDCNQNGVDDLVDVETGTSDDLNQNGVPDECDIANGTAQDCNGNGTLDGYEIAEGMVADCNLNGVIDACEIALGLSQDCDDNGVPDSCDIASGTAADCNLNGLIDTCEIALGLTEDCNDNGVPDPCDIASGTSTDIDMNGEPDECGTALFLRGDCNADGLFDLGDAIFALSALFSGGDSGPCSDACDANDDGTVDLGDAIFTLSHIFAGGPPPPAPNDTCGPDPSADALDCAAFAVCP